MRSVSGASSRTPSATGSAPESGTSLGICWRLLGSGSRLVPAVPDSLSSTETISSESAAEERKAPGGQGNRPYFSAQLQLLDSCNLRCAHCYNADAPLTRMPGTEEVKRRIDAVYAFAAEEGFAADIHLSGGEPTLRQDLPEIVAHIFDRPDGDALLFTNGTRWSEHLANELYAAGLRFVQVSLEGPEALTDEVRGSGVYRQAMETLELLGRVGFRRTVSITVTSKNFPLLFSFVQQLDSLQVHFHVREVLPLGAGEHLVGLSSDQRRRLYEWAVSWDGESSLSLEDPAHCSVSAHYARGRRGCVAGRNHLCIEVDGKVHPCRPLHFPVGTVQDLNAAWNSPIMRRLRERRLEGRCGRCTIRRHCGGCRVFALREGNLFGEDRRCFAPELGLVRRPFEQAAIELADQLGRRVWIRRQALSRWWSGRKDVSAADE